MKLPRHIVIKGKTWKLQRPRNIMLNKVSCDGLMSPQDRTIKVRSGLDSKRCLEVLMHEVIHAAIYELHLNEHGGIEAGIEEVLCSGISDIFLHIFDIKIGKCG